VNFGICITRQLYDDLIMPLFIERKHYSDLQKMEVARRIQVVLGTSSDFLTGTLMLYMFYHNALSQQRKRAALINKIADERRIATESRKATTSQNYRKTSDKVSATNGSDSLDHAIMDQITTNNPMFAEYYVEQE
jgi:hypothetical protein